MTVGDAGALGWSDSLLAAPETFTSPHPLTLFGFGPLTGLFGARRRFWVFLGPRRASKRVPGAFIGT